MSENYTAQEWTLWPIVCMPTIYVNPSHSGQCSGHWEPCQRAGSTNAPPNIQRSPAASAVFLHKCRGILLGCWALYRAGVTVEASARVRGGRPSEKKIQLVPAFSLVSRYCTLITRLYLHLTELSINGVHQIITVVFNGT